MIKIKLTILSLITVFLSLVVFVACSEEKANQNNEFEKHMSYKEDDVEIDYQSSIENNRLTLIIKIEDAKFNKTVHESFDISMDTSILSQEISNQITQKQKRLSSKFTTAEIKRLVNIMDNMIVSVTEKMKNEELKDIKAQGLFMCNSLIKSVNRQILINNKDLHKNEKNISIRIFGTNTVYEGFKKGMSSFIFNEDLEINVQDFINRINEDPVFAKEKGFFFTKEIFENKSSPIIYYSELLDDIIKYTADNPEKFEGPSYNGFKWPSGSTWGCCGNYSGPCYFYMPVCWVHDVICTNCRPRWFCFSGCVPD